MSRPPRYGRMSRVPISSDPPHRVLNRAIEWLARARDMLTSIPYFRSNLVSDSAVTKVLDDTLGDVDRAINRLCRLRDDLGWERPDGLHEPLACVFCGSADTLALVSMVPYDSAEIEPFHFCYTCRNAFRASVSEQKNKPKT